MDKPGSTHSWLPGFLRKSKNREEPTQAEDADETSTLFPKSDNLHHNPPFREAEERDKPADQSKSATKAVVNEFVILLKSSVPVILAYALQGSLQAISILIVGRESPADLATAAFSYMFAMSTGWLIGLGGSTALDTLASSSFTGSKNPHGLGILLQRAFIVLGLLYVPVAVLWLCSEPVFKALGQDDQLSRDSARFLSCLVPGGLGYIYFECMKKYLQAQGLKSCSAIQSEVNMLRNHAAGDICAARYFSHQRSFELSVGLPTRDGTLGCSSRNWHILLAFVSFARRIRMAFPGLGMLGRMVTKLLAQPWNVFPSGHPRVFSCRYGVVGV